MQGDEVMSPAGGDSVCKVSRAPRSLAVKKMKGSQAVVVHAFKSQHLGGRGVCHHHLALMACFINVVNINLVADSEFKS